ncbi:hypothetical protein, partial [Spinactinospora alkalitolerans]|uniref:hypothetical protein n=1 Tax=Spinactinospora alkalitolerans TaxID=687207 RepID=UPI0031D3EFC3
MGEAFAQVGVVASHLPGAFAGAVVGQQLLGCGGAGEAAHSVAREVEFADDLGDGASLSQQVVDLSVASAGALGQRPLPDS